MPGSVKVWLITSVLSPLGFSVATEALHAGDLVVGGCRGEEIDVDRIDRLTIDNAYTEAEKKVASLKEEGLDRIAFIELNVQTISVCQSAVADVISHFHQLDILLHCGTETYFGQIEDMPIHAFQAQFEATYFGTINIVRAALPTLRKQRKGHIMCVTGSTGQMGNPGLGARSAADHAVEGFLDALKFEIAPWDLRVTVVQPPFEANILSNSLTMLPLPPHKAETAAKTFTSLRELICKGYPIDGNCKEVQTVNPTPDPGALTETTDAILAVAGNPSPPVRVVVGQESIQLVLDRIRTISEEMEEFLETSMAADVPVAGKGSTLLSEDGPRGEQEAEYV